ncbi:unnamed protein product [Adineta steineri]|uniref:mitogen-activated protein kinase kinase n=1 Tax=Adineta steineri TaxID=433720 RepID=A0A815QR23_9BILA|nr:unnamed protein product [Adineta steineri]CAF1634632.1 unnamed protein product [Adineta steineri]
MTNLQIPREDIQLENEVGHGAFGTVYKAKWLSKNSIVACKCLNLTIGPKFKATTDMILKEIKHSLECAGPFILPIYGFFLEILSPLNSRIYLVMEYMLNGSLTDFLRRDQHNLTYWRRLIIAHDIASGMDRIHRHGIIHRDIRPDNILIDQFYRAKIGDMGIAQACYQNKDEPQGCMRYMPPEFYLNKYDQKLDVYTCGLTLNFLFTGVDHHYDPTSKAIKLTKISPLFRKLIDHCINEEANYRPTTPQIKIILLKFCLYLESRIRTYPRYHYLPVKQKDLVTLAIYREKRFDSI